MRLFCTLLVLMAASLPARNLVTPVTWNALPVPVQAAVKKYQAPSGAKVVYVKLARPGALSPLFEMKVDSGDGRDQEIVYRPDGSIVETEETIPVADVPAPVRAAIERAAQHGKLLKIDRIVRDDKTLYEGEILENGAKKKPVFNAAGEQIE